MEVFVVICYGILIVMTILGFSLGMVRVLTPLVSGILSLLLMLLLKNWAFGFLFQWAVFQGEHILSRIVVILLTFVLGSLLFRWVVKALCLLTKLPIIHGLNRILGAVAGFFEGTMLIWLIMFFIAVFPTVPFFELCHGQLMTKPFLSFLYEHNFVEFLMEMFTQISV